MWVLMLWGFLVSISWLPCGGRWRSAWRPVYWRGRLWARRSASLLPSLSLFSLSLSLSPSLSLHLISLFCFGSLLSLFFLLFFGVCFLFLCIPPPPACSLSLSPFLFSSPTHTLSSPPPACLVSLFPAPLCPLYTLSLCPSPFLPHLHPVFTPTCLPPLSVPHPSLPSLHSLPLSISLLSSPTHTLSSPNLPALSLSPAPLHTLSLCPSLPFHPPPSPSSHLCLCCFAPPPTSPIPSSAVRDWSLTVWCSLCSAYPCQWRVPVYRGWCLLIFQVLFL